MHSGIARPALVTISGALAAGWLLAACGDSQTADTETETTTTTTTAETTTEAPQTTEGDNTIEIPSPDIDVPEVTMTPQN
ncbi:hypothetical protein ABQE93_14030 [Mycolicibacterium sp. XJ662]